MRAFAYLRVSGISQVEGDGFPRQIEAIQKYAAANGIEVAHTFKELGVTGKADLENRPAMMEMLEAMETSRINTFLVERLDRLARDLLISEAILADMKRKGYTLISVAEPDLCSDDPSRKLLRQIMSGIAEYDRSMIVAKLRAAKQRKKQTVPGWREGRKPYGWTPAEQEVLSKMLSARTAGFNYQAITDSLNNSGIRTRMGRMWQPMTVKRILDRNIRVRSVA